MKIKSISIRGYRTIKDELIVEVEKSPTLVGPNNSGKTNALRAIRNFFTGYENQYKYDFETDIPKGEKSLRTNIQLTLSEIEEETNPEIYDVIRQIRSSLGVTTGNQNEITLYLTLSQNSNPVYRAFPNNKRPTKGDGVAYSRLEQKLFNLILDKFSIHYIPSEKSIVELYKTLVLPFLFQKVHQVVEPHMDAIRLALSNASDQIDKELLDAGLGKYKSSFTLPKNSEEIYKTIDFHLLDDNVTSVFSKGMGIQSATLFSAFCWIADQERKLGKQSLWLIEEPESYLHPELSTQCLGLLRRISEIAQVVSTTHSLSFVPENPERVIGISQENGWTRGSKFKTYHESTREIRKSLGVRFSDFYNMARYNVFIEGQTDRLYLDFITETLRKHENLRTEFATLASGEVGFQDFGGTKGLEGFMKATYEFISKERPCVTLLDGDDAGDVTRRALQSYFGQKNIQFQSNQDFIIVRDRFAIEGLLPDDWINEIQVNHPSWLENFAIDSQGTILPFKVKDSHKDQYFNWFKTKAGNSQNLEWMNRWRGILTAVETALNEKAAALYKAA